MSTTLDEDIVREIKRRVPDMMEQLVVFDGVPLELERDWQYDLAGSTYPYEITEKSRQIGFSFDMAARAVLRAHLFPSNSYEAVFVSINKDEAKEKVRYASRIIDGMRKHKKIVSENKEGIELVNGNRIRSYPSKAVRGAPNVDLYLDEFAHMAEAHAIYGGSSASTVRQSYGISIGSSPFGHGLFNDIMIGAGRAGEYRLFHANRIPWWHSHALCHDVQTAIALAPYMDTETRVMTFGKPNLQREYENHTHEMFRQEFECNASSIGNTALDEKLILSCADGDLSCEVHDNIDATTTSPVAIMEMVRCMVMEAKSRDEFHECYAGYDVGRSVHASELVVGDWTGKRVETRIYLTLRKAPYPLQEEIIRYLMNELPIKRFGIDRTGIGDNLAENLKRAYEDRVIGISFGEVSKSMMVSVMVKAFESKTVAIFPTPRVNRQLLSVRKVESSAGNLLYRATTSSEKSDTGGGGGKTHADVFWSMAMMLLGAQEVLEGPVIESTSRSPLLRSPNGAWMTPQMRVMLPRAFAAGGRFGH